MGEAERRILAVFAHPDDESFIVAGLAQKYAARGAAVELAVMTDGGAGPLGDPPLATREDLPALRRAECERATAHIGIRRVHFLGYPDRRLLWIDHREAVERLAGIIRRFRPQVVITFGPEGAGNEHPDHQATCHIATRAFFQAARGIPRVPAPPFQPAKLYYQSWPPGASVRRPGLEAQPTTTVIDVRGFVEGKRAAFLEHRTQAKFRALFERLLASWDGREYFHLAHTEGAWPGGTETCLYEGI